MLGTNLGLQDCRSSRKHLYLLGHLCVPTFPGCPPTRYLKQAFPHNTTLVQRKRHEPPRAHSFLVRDKDWGMGWLETSKGKRVTYQRQSRRWEVVWFYPAERQGQGTHWDLAPHDNRPQEVSLVDLITAHAIALLPGRA